MILYMIILHLRCPNCSAVLRENISDINSPRGSYFFHFIQLICLETFTTVNLFLEKLDINLGYISIYRHFSNSSS